MLLKDFVKSEEINHFSQESKDDLNTAMVNNEIFEFYFESRGPRHGQSVRQVVYRKARDMLRKAQLPKHGSCETILERWSTDAVYQKSLSDEGWTEEKIRQYDALDLEDHSYEATPAEKATMGEELAQCL